MSETHEDTNLAAALVGLSHHVLHLFADAGRAHDLTQQQAELVCAVIVRGRVGMSELGRALHMEKSALSNLVDRAEKRDLVTRTRDPHDRRATWVELTPEGARLAEATHDDVTARIKGLVEGLSGQDRAHLTGVLTQLRDAAQG
ncbi:MarR family transcriptional regulator [Nonomuraea sp. NBC_01738]|uniref:MarR family winged helix-turn-helix transcriptional regulator n=1 Tax=Nonomuraea sp. NBC_01738 TaxID=2976003 RepID=UPI002E0EC3D6|nr:MarR family transcriptional regulator [Nonomuraea sp. NBC_01738]